MDATRSQGSSEVRSRVWTWGSLAVVAALVFVYIAIVGPSRSSRGTTGAAVGRKLQYLELQPLTDDAKWVSLRDLAGQVAVVNYWGTWCGPCRAEFPDIVKLAAQFAERDGFRFLAVSCGEGADTELGELRSETLAFLKAREVTLPMYADQHASSRRELMRMLEPEGFGYPTTLVIDRQGTIRGMWQGPINLSEARALVQQLLDEPKTS
jgi:cytochrome c biogenesis protein CcmG/thiol:disulfide interchange protein DsbE